ncbi:MAG: hypothetical protein KDK78_03055 [Chlamydiia bacterium]|nr:hypothetical protein [Chlamydiia bacterium]
MKWSYVEIHGTGRVGWEYLQIKSPIAITTIHYLRPMPFFHKLLDERLTLIKHVGG